MRYLFKKTFLTRTLFFTVSDLIIIGFSVWLAFVLRFDGKIPQEQFINLKNYLIFIILFLFPIFFWQRIYWLNWSFFGVQDLMKLFLSVFVVWAIPSILVLIFRESFNVLKINFSGFPRSVLFISLILILIFLGALRISKRIYLDIKNKSFSSKLSRFLIVGAGQAGEQVIRNIFNKKNDFFFPVGFVDDDIKKHGFTIHGVRVLGKIEDIPSLVKKYNIEGLIIALPSVGSKIIKKAVEMGRISGLKKIKVIPSLDEIIDKGISLNSLREVEIEDLLGRQQVFLETKSIKDFIFSKSVLITGAAGSIGSELSRQVIKFNPESIFILDQDESGIFNIFEELKKSYFRGKIIPLVSNIQDEQKIDEILKNNKINIVFHAAAYKHVPLMEEYPDEAVKNNIFGLQIIAEKSVKYDIEKFVFISTDKAINPNSIMGATKRMGEMMCQALNKINRTKFISVRFGNVLDSRGSVIPIFREQIKNRGPVEVTHPEMKRYFMMTNEACLLVMQAGAMGQGGEVFVLDMGEPIKILDLAKEMIRLSGFEPDKDIPIVFTGIRPGEKLFEEILSAEEGTIATQNQKIYAAKILEIDSKKIKETLKELKETIKKQQKEKIKDILKNIISFYVSDKKK